jgi:hypothetical protein
MVLSCAVCPVEIIPPPNRHVVDFILNSLIIFAQNPHICADIYVWIFICIRSADLHPVFSSKQLGTKKVFTQNSLCKLHVYNFLLHIPPGIRYLSGRHPASPLKYHQCKLLAHTSVPIWASLMPHLLLCIKSVEYNKRIEALKTSI